MEQDEIIKDIALNTTDYDAYIKSKNVYKKCLKYYMNDKQQDIKKVEPMCNLEMSDKIEKSCGVMTSGISLSNWYEELQEGYSFGVLVDIKNNDLLKINAKNSKIYMKMNLEFLSSKDYFIMAKEYIDKYETFDGSTIISSEDIGSCNGLIPLYICKEHWEVAKQKLKQILGLMIAKSPSVISDKYTNIIFFLLVDSILDNKKIKNHKGIIILINLYRTCCQIAFENRYHKGIHKLCNNIKNDSINNNRTKDYYLLCIIGQLLSTNNTPYDICCLYENIFVIETEHKNFYISRLMRFYNIINLLSKKHGNFKKFLNHIDFNYGILEEDDINYIIGNI